MPSADSLILGLIQGLTEFLPVSSSGHLVIVSELLGYRSPGLVLEATVHLATTLVVIIYFRRRFASIVRGLVNDADAQRLALMLALALVATAMVGLALNPVIEAAFASPTFAGVMLLLSGCALLSLRFAPHREAPASLLDITWRVALLVGLVQGVAVLPGISRSGVTIVAGLWAGQSRSSAAEFSFLLAVPTLLAASLFSLVQSPQFAVADLWDVLAAFAVAFLFGLAAIHWLMRWLQGGRLWWFAIYCLLAGCAAVVLWEVAPQLS